MQSTFTSFLSTLASIVLGCLIPLTVKAQVTTDGTTSTAVNQNGNDFTIEQGDRIGDNLFHSFNEFSVPTQGSAAFNNAGDIANIFSRVTGSNISSIDGLISANGAANLFLINPNGIIFGENASLNLGGSFFASTADSLLFEGDTEFSASNPQAAPLLEVNIPIGLSFRENPGNIVNRSFNNGFGLAVLPGNNLTLLGGNVSFDSGIIVAPGANVELGGLTEAGIVQINDDSSLTFPNAIARGNVSLANNSLVAIADQDGGSININARNFELTNGSNILAVIRTGLGSVDTQLGDIIINATNDAVLDGVQGEQITTISNSNNGTGNTGNVDITAQNISFLNGGSIFSSSDGQGDIGNINLTATGDITFDGTGLNRSGILNSFNNPEATGNLGIISLSAQNLFITNGGQISSIVAGIADSGTINLNIDNSLDISGFGIVGSNPFVSEISSQVAESGVGDSGDININTQNLSITQNGQINASIAGLGNAGDIDINANTIAIDSASIASVTLTGLTNSAGLEANAGNITIDTNSLLINNGSNISAGVEGIGNGGNIIIDATDFIESNNGTIEANIFPGSSGDGGNLEINTARLFLTDGTIISADVLGTGDAGNITINATDSLAASDSSIRANIFPGSLGDGASGLGDGGNLQINTARIFLTDRAFISADVFGAGNGGNITVNATDSIEASNSFIEANIFPGGLGVGNGGNLQINTARLTVDAGAFVQASVFGTGNAGDITINATDSVEALGTAFISAVVGRDGEGNGGNLQINTTRLSVADEAIIAATIGISGEGNAGDININAIDSITLSEDARITANTFQDSTGNGGNLTIETKILTTKDTGRISATSFGNGNAGSVTIKASDSITLSGASETTRSGLFASALSSGNGGDLSIFTDELTISNGATINVSNIQSRGLGEPGTGEAGNLEIEANSISLANDALIIAATESGAGGNITLEVSEDIILRNNSSISAEAGTDANGGNLNIDTTLIIAFPDGNNDIFASAEQGQGGNINITAESLFGIEEGPLNPFTNDINASSEFGLEGNIAINTPEVDPTSGLINLPASVGDASDQISQNPCEQGLGSEFIVTGKGGLPPNVNESLNSESTQVGLIETVPSQQQKVTAKNIPSNNSIAEAVPAMGWVFNDKGEVTLTAYSNTDTEIKRSHQAIPDSCSAPKNK